MVARFPTPRKNVRRVVYYSENKVKQGTAEYICAVNFHKEIEEMTADEKVEFFLQRNLLRPSCKANTPHIVLGFHPSERLSKEKFAEIAQDFMERIGFGEQPFLVYYHTDTQSPHLHIVTTLIRADGSRINPHNIGKEKCLPACQVLEEKYHLIKAKGRRTKADQAAAPVVGEARVHGLLARVEGLEHERPGADLAGLHRRALVRVADRDDVVAARLILVVEIGLVLEGIGVEVARF